MKSKKLALATALAVGIASFVFWDTSSFFIAKGNYKKAKVSEQIIARNTRLVEEINLVRKCGFVDVINDQRGVKMDRACFAEILPQLQDNRSIVFAVAKASEWLKLYPKDAEIAAAASKALDVAWRDAARGVQLVDLANSVGTANNDSLIMRMFRIMPTDNQDHTLLLVSAEAALAAPGFVQKIAVRNVAFAREVQRDHSSDSH